MVHIVHIVHMVHIVHIVHIEHMVHISLCGALPPCVVPYRPVIEQAQLTKTYQTPIKPNEQAQPTKTYQTPIKPNEQAPPTKTYQTPIKPIEQAQPTKTYQTPIKPNETILTNLLLLIILKVPRGHNKQGKVFLHLLSPEFKKDLVTLYPNVRFCKGFPRTYHHRTSQLSKPSSTYYFKGPQGS